MAGVAFQLCRLTDDVLNFQVMVMLSYATAAGHAFVGRRLYLPEEWTVDPIAAARPGFPTRSPSPPSPNWPSSC
jgi:SRSO17 transposase